jgi:hypothetical protein
MAIPVIPIILVGGLIGIIALLLDRKKEPTSKLIDKPIDKEPIKLSPKIKVLVGKAEIEKNPKPLLVAAIVAKQEGNIPLANALKKRSDGMKVEQGLVVYKSPFPNVSPEQWTKFANLSRAANPHSVTKDFHIGLFQFGARRLCDLKVMKNCRQETYQGKKVWTADWTPPWNLQKFLADTAYQYQLFANSNLDYGKKIAITPVLASMVGKEIDGKKVTLSGLLAVTRRAGFSGMQSWLKLPKDRRKFSTTTAEFNKLNGIF